LLQQGLQLAQHSRRHGAGRIIAWGLEQPAQPRQGCAGLVAPALLKLKQSAEGQVRGPGALPTESIEAFGPLQCGLCFLELSETVVGKAQGIGVRPELGEQTTDGLLPAQSEAVGCGAPAAVLDHWPDGGVD